MRKNFTVLIIAVACLLMTATLAVNTVAYAAIDKDVIFKPGTGLGGGGIVVYVNDSHIDEAENFATIDRPTKSLKCHGYVQDVRVSKPDRNSDYNNIDDVIFMIGKLEKLAMEYTNSDRQKAINCVSGYIRGINKDYAGKDERQKDPNDKYDGIEWKVVCGPIDKGFISFVATKEKADEITFPEFFASFLQNASNYNSFLHGAVDDVYLNKAYKVPDPLGTGQSIDLIHMFAAMDGIYLETEHNKFACDFAFGGVTIQRDIVSWLGDLHQLINSLKDKNIEEKTYSLAEGFIDFNTYLGEGGGFSSDDLLADIDAFNIIKFFVDWERNPIANAFYGYYNNINKDKATKGNRFYEFIYTATLDLECATMPNIVESFRRSACSESNVGYENGGYWEADIRSGLRVHLMGGASYQTRKICAKLFCDYIIALSGRTE